MNVSLAFTTYFSANYIKKQLALDFFSLSDGWIDEIVIQDDCSTDYEELQSFQSEKIKLFRNPSNLSPLLSRPNLVGNCKNDWVILMDSDNFLNRECLAVLKNLELDRNTIYCPSFARPNFRYSSFAGKTFSLNQIKAIFDSSETRTFLNTGNYLVSKNEYLETCKNIDPKFCHFTVDVVYFNYLWLKSGKKLSCINGYEYDHTLRGDSYYMTHSGRSGAKLEEVNQMYSEPIKTYVQIGACVGNDDFQKMIEKLQTPSRVILIEPNHKLLETLRKNYENVMKTHDVVIYNKAISTYDGQSLLYIYSEDGHSSLIKRRSNNDALRDEIPVESVSITKMCEELGVKDIEELWIDAEGLDYEIINSIDTSARKINVITFEEWHFSDDDLNGKYKTGHEFRNNVVRPKFQNYNWEGIWLSGAPSVKLTLKN